MEEKLSKLMLMSSASLKYCSSLAFDTSFPVTTTTATTDVTPKMGKKKKQKNTIITYVMGSLIMSLDQESPKKNSEWNHSKITPKVKKDKDQQHPQQIRNK